MSIENREEIEWSNTWISNANTYNKRCLLIGDSITRQIRVTVENMLCGGVSVDLFAASFAIKDKLLMQYLSNFFDNSDYMYEFIILHYGGQHGFSDFCSKNQQFYDEFYKNYERIVKYIHLKCKRIVVMSYTSNVLKYKLDVLDEVKESEIVVRNKIISDIAHKNNCHFFDLHGLMKSQWNIYGYIDYCHFKSSAYYYMSYEILSYLINDIIPNELVEQQIVIKQMQIIDLLGYNKKIILYGFGDVAKQIYWQLKWNRLKISFFAVTKLENFMSFDGKMIVEINNVPREERDTCMLIIASEKYESEMWKTGVDYGFERIVSYKDIIKILE